MPKRPSSHVRGDIGQSGALHFLNRCGWACEIIKNDYGEDLLAQTKHGSAVDHSRVYLQVKSTADIARFNVRGKPTVRFDKEHILRWLRSADLVVLILWDTEADHGFFAIPSQVLSEWQLLGSSANEISITFRHKLTREQVRRIAWIARIAHYDRLIAHSWFLDDNAATSGDVTYDSETGLIAGEMLVLLDIFRRRRDDAVVVNPGFYLQYIAAKRSLRGKRPSTRWTREEIALLALLHWIQRKTGAGVPASVLRAGARMLAWTIAQLEKAAGAKHKR
jgi:Domain of unknown function (DUF4365)